MQVGEKIRIRALKACGDCYRWWPATIEALDSSSIVTVSRAGHAVHGPKGGWISKFDVRGVYWLDRPYNLVEVYLPDGQLKQVYIHIASPARVEGNTLIYTDHELDIVRRPGQQVRVVDEHEFEAAAEEYGYTPDFRSACRSAVADAVRLAARWCPKGPPGRCQPERTSAPAMPSSTRKREV